MGIQATDQIMHISNTGMDLGGLEGLGVEGWEGGYMDFFFSNGKSQTTESSGAPIIKFRLTFTSSLHS